MRHLPSVLGCWKTQQFSLFTVQTLKLPKLFLESMGPLSPPSSMIDSGNVRVRFPGDKLGGDGVG